PGGSSSRSEIGNFHDLQIRRPTPIGLFPAGDSRFGVADLLGNVEEWTRSLFGPDPERPSHAYPYDAGDGREDPLAAADMHRVCRGGAWTDSLGPSRSGSPYLVVRNAAMPSDRRMSRGMRLAVGA
ncbi:MAG: SUMF1/EgtB/PvdO family nonheme iron enzyme, partial [Chloroflexi bacterium]|nr:SUMF1/EgtB/PvdO family nonheme iron enzyme [Chloroflexota bacterium]